MCLNYVVAAKTKSLVFGGLLVWNVEIGVLTECPEEKNKVVKSKRSTNKKIRTSLDCIFTELRGCSNKERCVKTKYLKN